MPVWYCGDPSGWNRYKGLVPWHQADRTGEIEELLELPLMTYTTKLYILYSYQYKARHKFNVIQHRQAYLLTYLLIYLKTMTTECLSAASALNRHLPTCLSTFQRTTEFFGGSFVLKFTQPLFGAKDKLFYSFVHIIKKLNWKYMLRFISTFTKGTTPKGNCSRPLTSRSH